MHSPITLSIYFRSLNGSSPFWDLTFHDPVEDIVGFDSKEVVPLIEKMEDALSDGHFAAGFISYEAAPAFDSAIPCKDSGDFPKIWFRIFKSVSPLSSLQDQDKDFFVSDFKSEISKMDYKENVNKIKRYIFGGDSYQVNYTYRLQADFEGSELSLFSQLCEKESSPFAAYIDCGRYVILSMSPEMFFHLDGRTVRVKPMKGTMERGVDSKSDEENLYKLANSNKDISENLMIVDLMRNDLGKISVPGSVRASSLFNVERYKTLFQMTSEVESILNGDISILEVFKSLFPCGSVTGAPKIRSMEIIDEMELSPRKIYTGAIGYLTPSGVGAFNVAIRTAIIDRHTNTLEYGTGGGIVSDSTPEGEFEESLAKSIFIRSVRPSFRLIETFLYEQGKDIFLFEEHLQRVERSASYFGFNFDRSKFIAKIDEVIGKSKFPEMKIRVLLSSDGSLEADATKLSAQRDGRARHVKIYGEGVDKNSIFRYHKTTMRGFFEIALNNHPEVDDLIFLNQDGEVTETSIANIVIEKERSFYTPRVCSGLLPGTFREKLLRDGVIEEKVLRREDLESADGIFLINSVRKWETAEIVPG